jgi:hypothetical protein
MPALIRPFEWNIQPLKCPSGKLYFVDFVYETISEKRKKKLEEIYPEFKDEK